ncbi:MAG: zinc-binding dehydrogenase [Flavobacteriales bacterium]|nr:zinc-binding dehydrogenase [Flavobacteriales bacterium]
MKAFVLKGYGEAEKNFFLSDVSDPIPKNDEVLIRVEAFGLNFADVMARLGLYQDAPPLPAILGYDVVGTVIESGDSNNNHLIGKRVVALTRFGGYAELAVAKIKAIAEIPSDFVAHEATALATQYCTAYYATHIATTVPHGSIVLIHAAAGGVGQALVQLCLAKKCKIIATCSSTAKQKLLTSWGVNYAINYSTSDFEEEIKKLSDFKGLDVIFDSIGGSFFKKNLRLLAPGGKMVCYGGAQRSGKRNAFSFFKDIRFVLGFGIMSPIPFLIHSKSLIGINMLRIADNRPELIGLAMEAVIQLVNEQKIPRPCGQSFSMNDLSIAHELLENRKTTGKLAILWK